MKTKTVMTVLGTRPEAIKLAPVILGMSDASYNLQPLVCVTGQHRQMLDQVLDWFKIKPDYDLDLMRPNQDLAEFAALALTGLNSLFQEVKPDAVLVQGDTTTAMIAALAAFYNRIPVGHVEAGLRTRDIYNPFPEEMNRRMAGVIASFHFAPTQRAADALLSEQVDPARVFVVGNTVVDALLMTVKRNEELTSPVELNGHRNILVTAHRRESFGDPFASICGAIRDLVERNEDVEVIYPVHLNPNVRDPVMRILSDHSRIRLIEPLRYEQFVNLMSRCDLILTDSGGIQEEATVLGKPTLIMRETTERPEAIAFGTAVLVGTNRTMIVETAEHFLRDVRGTGTNIDTHSPFGDGHASERILTTLSHLQPN